MHLFSHHSRTLLRRLSSLSLGVPLSAPNPSLCQTLPQTWSLSTFFLTLFPQFCPGASAVRPPDRHHPGDQPDLRRAHADAPGAQLVARGTTTGRSPPRARARRETVDRYPGDRVAAARGPGKTALLRLGFVVLSRCLSFVPSFCLIKDFNLLNVVLVLPQALFRGSREGCQSGSRRSGCSWRTG